MGLLFGTIYSFLVICQLIYLVFVTTDAADRKGRQNLDGSIVKFFLSSHIYLTKKCDILILKHNELSSKSHPNNLLKPIKM